MRRDQPYPDPITSQNLDKIGLSQQTVDGLPRWGHHPGGKAMEWMNLVIIGEQADIEATLETAGWHRAHPVTPLVLLKAFLAIVLKKQYLNGPFTLVFVGNQPQRLSYQKPTRINRFKQRHHARFWSTNFSNLSGQPVWIAHASYDVSIKGVGVLNFPPVHKIHSDIDAEREIIVQDIQLAGAKLRGYIQLQPAGGGVNAYGDRFKSDGRAAVLEVRT